VLGRRVRVVSRPAALCAVRSACSLSAVTDRLGVRDLRTVEQVLREKASLEPVG
jgi:hypothetical protein